MSNTYKDEPLWVRTKKETFHVRWVHRQWNIGRVQYRNVIVRDENNNPIYEPYEWEGWDWISYWKDGVEHEKAVKRTYQGKVLKTEKIAVGSFKPYCTCGMDDETVKERFNRNPCFKVLTKAVEPNYYAASYPGTFEGETTKTKQKLKQMKNAYNSGEMDLDEDEFASVYEIKPPLEYVH